MHYALYPVQITAWRLGAGKAACRPSLHGWMDGGGQKVTGCGGVSRMVLERGSLFFLLVPGRARRQSKREREGEREKGQLSLPPQFPTRT
ncbi:hypothetical protein IF1G_02054 [Cordyceps javanica]|uniref:Uncharacterized protein n=1 Tax=Cordyceps javanica TaxID=43265 RepID=A0A545VDX8_9HYPO|nr:hypothetical protein IF1G_02054 [Cordyceps javanica]